MKLPEQVQVEGVKPRSVTLDGFDAHVASAGDADGEPVVLSTVDRSTGGRSATLSARSRATAAACSRRI
jgi:hypothetical protein